ncbi:major facilitator superfamily domain-containing protein [Hyaloraphidium curvatum]|nr:major facilitator superfamily domain-containing protein [Hyaloraphidium curvatum]
MLPGYDPTVSPSEIMLKDVRQDPHPQEDPPPLGATTSEKEPSTLPEARPSDNAGALQAATPSAETQSSGNEVPVALGEPVAPRDAGSFLARLPTLDFRTVPKLTRGGGISRPLVLLLGLASLIEVSNLYVSQPLLNDFVEYFNTSKASASSLVALSQAGYCIGLFLITPLGDAMPRRLLVISLTALCSVLTVLCALAPSMVALQILHLLLGLFTVVPQIAIPTVADVSEKGSMARNVGLVVGCTLIGTLYGRVVAGLIANALGWRAVFYVSTGSQVLILILLFFFFPQIPAADSGLSYPQLLLSCLKLARSVVVLQQSFSIAFFCYIAMTSFWVTSVFLMGSPVYDLPVSTIGLLGLAGIGGILAAPIAGYLPFDPHTTIILGISTQTLSWTLALAAGTRNVAVLFVCAFIMDLGRQLQQVSNQLRIYGALPGHKSRANSVYMLLAYMGTFVGTALGTFAYDQAGWNAAGAVGLVALGAAAVGWAWVSRDGAIWYDRFRKSRRIQYEGKDEVVALEDGPVNEVKLGAEISVGMAGEEQDSGSDVTVEGGNPKGETISKVDDEK